ncbi:aspartate/glutamate racemase family protein [Xanthobacter autotrophicus]|uniref:aspartate/glutamate racemase family protein n=1 Tax=Xanthobacter TaxID=279 RepID=UPI0024AA4DBB|nr:aspartate/glutamate racemase family protein [Xanthobacter autotrophicus]MDI4665490.1 aspartate/glutamate racemase family protein [Xanthobacter autotrophicus]
MSRTIGLIGGMSWESTAVYYKEINELVRDRRGGLASADILLHSVNFDEIVAMQKAGRWDLAEQALADTANGLVKAGAGCILICTNTMHLVADTVARAVPVPLLHIVDVVGHALVEAGMRKPLLLATRYTMEQDFYRDRMTAKFGLETIVPEDADRIAVHDIIFDELCCGIVKDTSRARYVEVIEKAAGQGADCVILGCTEIGMLIDDKDSPLPAFDSTKLHARAAVDFFDGSLEVETVAA